METKKPPVEKHHHHILPTSVAVGVGIALLILTVVTVVISRVDLGSLNFFVAMLVATIKASLVTLFFMNLLYDHRENGVIFGTSVLFLAIFIVLAGTDIFFRGDVYVKGPLIAEAKSKLKDPWVSTPQLVSKGKEIFALQCASCHGAEGKGNGAAAAGLRLPPRNFTSDQGWKNGRKPSMVFKTLKEGLPADSPVMPSFSTLAADDRWAVVHYVLSLSPTAPGTDTAEDFKLAGINTSGGGEEKAEASIPVGAAMKLLAQADAALSGSAIHTPETSGSNGSLGAKLYDARCAKCHGEQGAGGIVVKNLGVNPKAFLTTQAFTGQSSGLQSAESFRKVVVDGIPGEVMPGAGDLGSSEIQELYQYTKSLAQH